MNPNAHSYLHKVKSEKLDYSYESFTNTEDVSDESFKITIKIDRDRIKKMSEVTTAPSVAISCLRSAWIDFISI